jgi:hypothetical protein
MHCRAIVIGLLLLLPSVSLGQETKKWPIPNKDAQAKIESLLNELYADDFAKAAKDPALRGRLAQTLLFEGKETKDDPAGRYVLFSKAHALAAQAGDVNTALQAADELAHNFIIAPSVVFQMKIKMLKQASGVEGAPVDAYRSVIDRALLTLDDTLDSDDYPSSLELIDAAEKAARQLRSIALVTTMRKKQDEIVRLQKEFARWEPFANRLTKIADDAEANLEMGKYYALVKGNWERGLPLLAKGSPGALKNLAAGDIAAPEASKAKKAVALGWYLLATNKASDPAMTTQALLRAFHWYQENLADASDSERINIEGKLKDINNLLPAAYRIGEITAELKKIDVFSGPVYGCAFSPDGKRFITSGYDNHLHLFNAKTFKEIRQLDGHTGKVFAVALRSASGTSVWAERSRSSRDIRITSAPSRSPPTPNGSSPAAMIAPCASGTRRPARKNAPSWVTAIPSGMSRCRAMANVRCPRASTKPRACGTWTRARRSRYFRATRIPSCASRFHPMADTPSPAAVIRRCACGT